MSRIEEDPDVLAVVGMQVVDDEDEEEDEEDEYEPGKYDDVDDNDKNDGGNRGNSGNNSIEWKSDCCIFKKHCRPHSTKHYRQPSIPSASQPNTRERYLFIPTSGNFPK